MPEVKALFIPTSVTGVVYWRMYNFINAAFRNLAFDGHLLWWQKNMNEVHPWQHDIADPRYKARILNELDANAKLSNIIVIGLVGTHAGMMAVQGLRECYGRPVVMEIDDNILSCPEYNPAAATFGPNNPTRTIAIQQMRESDAIIVSTPYLKELYSEFNDHIYVVPNSIDFELWDRVQHGRNKGRISIGWVGGANHKDYLEIIEPCISAIIDKYPQAEFVFGHGMHPDFKGRKGVRHMPAFSPVLKYPKMVARMGLDIGLAPLVDNAFNRAKSNLRWLEYSALGIPTVASNVGRFAETIHDGADGMLCDTADDFTTAIESLIKDKAKRKCMARDAKARVFKDFNVDTTARKYGDILADIIDRGQIKRATTFKDSNFKQEAVIV